MWEIIIIATLFIEIGICIYALKRNEWVLSQRLKALQGCDPSRYHRLPSYDRMLLGHGFWVWDVDYFLDT